MAGIIISRRTKKVVANLCGGDIVKCIVFGHFQLLIYIPFLFDRFWLRRSCLQEYWHWIDLSNWMPFYFKWYHTWLIEYFWCVLNSCILFYIILPRYGIKCLSYLMFFKIYIYIYKWNEMKCDGKVQSYVCYMWCCFLVSKWMDSIIYWV